MIIGKISNNLSNRNNYDLSFKGYNDQTYGVSSHNKQDWCLHETAFFRDIDTMEFTKDYIIKNFPNGTNIADFGCSNGEEAYTLLMLLNKSNRDKKYKITGYDVSPKVVEIAQNGVFAVKYRQTEGFLLSKYEYKDYDKKYLKKLFFECFEKVPEKFISFSPSKDVIDKLEQKIKNENDVKKLLELKCYHEIFRRVGHYNQFEEGCTFRPKPEFAIDAFSAKQGDINALSNIIESDGKTGVIIFKNAWFHVLNTFNSFDDINIDGAAKIIQSAQKVLPKKGIFVVGTLWKDHLYSSQQSHVIVQNKKEIEVVDNTIFHNLFRENGFEPVFFEDMKDVVYGKFNSSKIHLPSVWRKI